ncbi:hypothetical protein [Flavonifractor plautii]|uniref:hypothetical protein n=1 Tax=Flavonifractor plautii TaxID=292800 RepID=UPI0018A8ECBF|nr:hypothetical protein [Flavonifractor plautii]
MGCNEFEVGDIVTIVDEPYFDCPFIWVSPMDEYLGAKTIIVKKDWSEEKGVYRYRIDIDNRNHVWCGNCFRAEPDFDVAEDSDIIDLLGL